jgi:DNA polymerase III gamma/tau subunit
VPDHERHEQEPATIDPQILETWQRKSNDEIREAASNLHQYTETGRQIIQAEIARRRIVVEDEDQQTFCYHCGSDVAPGSRMCASCGKAL